MAPDEKKKRRSQVAQAVAERAVADQVPPERRREMLEYLKLFGYNPDRTILQIHIPGFFNKRRGPRATEKSAATARRYGGTTFVIVGRTHDSAIMDQVIKPRKRREEASPGYVGYLWKNKDSQGRAPHEVVPLDFTPMHVPYPQDWKGMFATRGFMVAMHVPSSFAKDKSRLSKALYRARKNADAKKRWDFIEQVRDAGYGQGGEDPMNILKIRLAKGEIGEQEYERLRGALAA
jgi:hypothetical protein